MLIESNKCTTKSNKIEVRFELFILNSNCISFLSQSDNSVSNQIKFASNSYSQTLPWYKSSVEHGNVMLIATVVGINVHLNGRASEGESGICTFRI